MDNKTNEILDGLKLLFEKAENENLWFYSTYQHLWFSPKELKEQQAKGRYIWDAINWTLRSPLEKLQELENKKDATTKEIESFQKRILNL